MSVYLSVCLSLSLLKKTYPGVRIRKKRKLRLRKEQGLASQQAAAMTLDLGSFP